MPDDASMLGALESGVCNTNVLHFGMAVDWSRRGEYIAKHGITPLQADEAHDDPDAVTFEPDYNSISGDSVRTIGYSPSTGVIISVISYEEGGIVYGASAWKSNSRDRRYYQQGGPDEQA
jgi:uncharacterized DUF497 family protein